MTIQTSVALKGPFTLDRGTVVATVTRKSPSVYVLSRNGKTAHYVGRSDQDLRARLLDHATSGYNAFWYDYATSPRDAFYKECTLYHRYGGSSSLDNRVHPDRPTGSGWRCPNCRVFG